MMSMNRARQRSANTIASVRPRGRLLVQMAPETS